MTRSEILHPTLALILLLTFAAAAQARPSDPGAPPGPPTWERFAGRHDLDGDGQVSADEFGRSDLRFRELDADGDGLVVRDDFEQALAEGRRRAGAGFLRLADGDRDGEVTAGEWADFVGEIDADGNGVVREDELPAPPRQGRHRIAPPEGGFGPGPFGPDPERLLGLLDTDGNGVLEVTDLEAAFATADRNGDGALTGDEVPEPRGFGAHRPHLRPFRGTQPES